jgi:hypothetical protein
MIFLRIIGALITLPLLFFAPGYVLVRSRLFSDSGMWWGERVLLILVISASLASLIALAMAEAGYLRIWLLDLVLGVIALCGLLLLRGAGRPPVPSRRVRWELLVVLALVVISAVLFFRPAEVVLGEGDTVYYFNIGYHLADAGSMNVYDPSIPKMDDAEIKTFYFDKIGQFFPFQLRDRTTGRVQPLLYHLLPTWIGLFIMLFGKWGGLYVVPVFGLLGMLALYALARRLAGIPGAVAATILATTFFLQVWFSRAPVSEIFCQFFVICSVLLFFAFLVSRDIATGLGSALAITAASTARPEAAILVVPMLVIMLAEMFREKYRAGDCAFINTVLAGIVYVLLYIRFCEFDYVSGNFGKVVKLFGDRATMGTVLIILGILVAAAFVLFNLRPLQRALRRLGGRLDGRLEGRTPQVVSGLKLALALATLATFIYLFPAVADPAGPLRSPQKIFINTSLYFGGVTVFVFVIGFCLLVYLGERLSYSFLLSFGAVVLATALQKSSLALGQYPWDSRRLMLLTIPLFFVGFGYLVSRAWGTGRIELRLLGILTTAGFLALFCFFLAPIFSHVDYRGTDKQLTELAGKLDGDVVIFTNWYLGETLGMPLKYQHHIDARKVYRLDDPETFARIVDKYTKGGKKVLIEMSGVESKQVPYSPDLNNLLSFGKALEAKISFPRLYPSFAGRAHEFVTQRHDITFYQVQPKVAGGR